MIRWFCSRSCCSNIKASANLNKKIKQEVPAAAKRYRDELAGGDQRRPEQAHGKKPFDDGDPPDHEKETVTLKKKKRRGEEGGLQTVTKSTTRPDVCMFVKGKFERQFAYLKAQPPR